MLEGGGVEQGQARLHRSALGVLSFAPQRNICRSGALRCPGAVGGPWATASEPRSQHRAPGQGRLSLCEADIGFPSLTPLTVVAQKDP